MNSMYGNVTIDQIHLPIRAYNALQRKGYKFLREIMDMKVHEILDLREVGTGTLGDIITAVDKVQRQQDLETRLAALEEEVKTLRASCPFTAEGKKS